MASEKQIKQLLKDMHLSKEDMQKYFDELEDTNQVVSTLKRSGCNWTDLHISVIAQIPTQKEKDLEAQDGKHLEELKKAKQQEDEQKKKKYYEDHFEELMVEKIDTGESLTKDEIIRITEYEIERGYGDSGRWTRDVSTVLKMCDRFFMLNWRQGLTEYQGHEFYTQPYEVEKKEYEKMVVIKEWIPKSNT